MTNHEIYIIYSAGRTGSHIILETLAGEHDCAGGLCHTRPYWHATDRGKFNLAQHKVIHTHNLDVVPELNLDIKSTTLILSRRRDIFAQVMSRLVAELVGEWSGKDYSNKNIVPVAIDQNKFINLVDRFTSWPKYIPNQSQYKNIVSIDYEDIINTNQGQYIANRLGIKYAKSSVGTVQPKSPYRYQDYITNWAELKNLYHAVYNNK